MHFAAAAADDATNELPNVAAASAASAAAAADLALHSIAEALLGNFSSRSPHAKVTRKSSGGGVALSRSHSLSTINASYNYAAAERDAL